VGAGVGLMLVLLTGGDDKPAADPDKDRGAERKEPSKPVVPQKPPEPVGKPLVVLKPEDQDPVNKAAARAAEFLNKTHDPNTGTWPGARVGCTALPALTLLECGLPATDPAVQKAAAYVRNASGTLVTTYDLALAILFLDRLNDPADRKLIRTLAFRLVAGQTT